MSNPASPVCVTGASAGTGVDGNGHLADFLFFQHADEQGQHRDRQVVDAVIARVFEKVEGDGLAGAGETADENEFHELQHNEGGAPRQAAA